jgi:hypothetical protein
LTRPSIAHQQAGQKTAPYQCRCVNLTVATRERSTKDLGVLRIRCTDQPLLPSVICHLSSLDRYTASLWSLRANSIILPGIVRGFFAFSVSVCGLTMSPVGTNRTCRADLTMSVDGGKAEVGGTRSNRRD